jgi:transcriptional regulator with XRE-family HTH domain
MQTYDIACLQTPGGFKAAREALGLTQHQLAAALGYESGAPGVANLEHGRVQIRRAVAMAMAWLLMTARREPVRRDYRDDTCVVTVEEVDELDRRRRATEQAYWREQAGQPVESLLQAAHETQEDEPVTEHNGG